MAQRLKRLPAMLETWVQSLGREDPLEKEMAIPLQYSCLENAMDRGAWWATVHRGRKESDTTERLNSFFLISPEWAGRLFITAPPGKPQKPSPDFAKCSLKSKAVHS